MAWELTLIDNLNNDMGDNSSETEFTLMQDFIIPSNIDITSSFISISIESVMSNLIMNISK
jgi:hypothetical protein